MNQKDIVLIIVIAFFAGAISIFSSKALFTSSKNRDLSVQQVDKVESGFKEVDTRVFNAQAINPTRLINIGDSTNPKPF